MVDGIEDDTVVKDSSSVVAGLAWTGDHVLSGVGTGLSREDHGNAGWSAPSKHLADEIVANFRCGTWRRDGFDTLGTEEGRGGDVGQAVLVTLMAFNVLQGWPGKVDISVGAAAGTEGFAITVDDRAGGEIEDSLEKRDILIL